MSDHDDQNYRSTFISVSDDTKATEGVEPPAGRGKKMTEAQMHHELTREEAYFHNQEQVLFKTYLNSKGIDPETEEEGGDLWNKFFETPQSCLRESPLAQKYGWGFHFNQDGLVAAWPMESAKYRLLSENPDLNQIQAFSA